MQWTNETNYTNNDIQADVYSDVKTSYSADRFNQENQEFSLSSIQEKLGSLASLDEMDASASSADVMPSTQTLNMSYNRQYAEQTRVASKLSAKSKVMIVGYTLIVLSLILAVTLCSVAVSGSFLSTSALNAEYTEVSDSLAELTAQLQEEDYAALAERAAQLGYIDASQSNTQTYTEIETRPAQNFNVQTNWFDSLCDWLSGAFGG